jgi:hypothetical protein
MHIRFLDQENKVKTDLLLWNRLVNQIYLPTDFPLAYDITNKQVQTVVFKLLALLT